jgi:hypothetical protein
MKYDNFPKELRELKQWVSWKWSERKGKKTKILLQANGDYAESNNPDTWDSFENVKKRKDAGIGFVFLKGVVGIDLDHAFFTTGENKGQLKIWARKILEKFNSYTEYSPSMIGDVHKGVHIIAITDTDFDGLNRKLTPEEREEKEMEEGIECYVQGRFFTVTGDVYEGKKELRNINGKELESWVDSWRANKKVESTPSPFMKIIPDDENILTRIRKSKNGPKFQTLYDLGNYQSLGFGSQSEADLSLVSSLMFWCCNQKNIVDRLFRGSRLFRDKWDEKHGVNTYGERTIDTAVRAEIMDWSDPRCEDKRDLLATINYKGNVSIEKINNDYKAITFVPPGKVIFDFSEVINTSQSIDAIIVVNVVKDNEEQTPFRYNIDIKSQNQQEKLATSLNKAYGTVKEGFNWTLIINRVFNALLMRLNGENMMISLKGILPEDPDFLVYPFLQKDTTSIFYGYGDTGKTWLAIYFCIKMALGMDFLGYRTQKNTNVLFIDYEDTLSTFTSRLHKLCIGMDVEYESVTDYIHYQKFIGSVKDTFSLIKKQIIGNNIDLIILDSGGQASGGSPNDETKVIQLFGYLEHLPCTKLVLHHEPKSTMGMDDNKAFYGTSYWHSSSRAMFRLAVESKDNNEKIIKVSKAKGNNFGDIDPIYYKLIFTNTEIAQLMGKKWGYVDLQTVDKDTLKHNIDREDSILRAIGDEGASFSQILQMTGMPKSSLKRELDKMEEIGKIEAKKQGRNITYYLTTERF